MQNSQKVKFSSNQLSMTKKSAVGVSFRKGSNHAQPDGLDDWARD